MRSLLQDLARLLRPHRRAVATLVAVNGLSAIAFGALEPVGQKLIIDSLTTRRTGTFVAVAIGMVLLNTAVRGVTYTAALTTQRLKNVLGRELTVGTFDTFYRLPYREVARQDRGYYVQRVFDDPSRAAVDVVDNVVAVVGGVLTFVAAAAVVLWLSWEVALAATVLVPLLLALSKRFTARIAAATERVGEEEAVLKGGLGRAVDAYKTVAIFDLYGPVRGQIEGLLDRYFGTTYRRHRDGAAYQAASSVLMAYAELVVLLGAGVQVVRGALTIGGLFAFLGAYWRVVMAANTLIARLPAFAKLRGQLARLAEFEASRGPVRAGAAGTERGPRTADTDVPAIEVRGAAFGYADEPVFRDLSFRVARGARVLVTGANGSGKTTVAHMIAGFLPAAAGEVRTPPLERVSALLLPFGFVPGTVADNVGLDRLPAAKRAAFHTLAERFGVADKLGQDPVTLSQGEQRKVQVAMTLLKDADVYVLDEPLSNVDVESRDVMMGAIFEATAGRGLVLIMHGDEQYRGAFDAVVEIGKSEAPDGAPIGSAAARGDGSAEVFAGVAARAGGGE